MKSIDELGISDTNWVTDGGYIESSDGTPIAEMLGFGTYASTKDQLLMTAAPELYEAVVDLIEIINEPRNGAEYAFTLAATLERAKAALAKASGED